ncbi:MAG: hypothetical protein KAI28_09235 [Sphingomonadales bacterium]|nr:hypothetical protein [Sphingomonadales bacterium]
MLFAMIYKFGNDIDNARAEARPAHIHYLKSAGDRLKLAGPLTADEDGNEAKGSLILLEAQSRTAVKLFADADPYVQAGIVDSIDISAVPITLGDWAPKAD